MTDELIDMDRLCRILGGSETPLHRATVHRHVREGKVPAPIKVGGANRWLMSEIEEMIERAKAERGGRAA